MKFWYNPNFLSIFALTIISIPALISLSANGFYTSHDGETHIARIAQYYQAIVDGQIPPRLAGSFYNGLTSPIFVYIYPLPYLLGAFIHLMGFSYVNSFKLMTALSFIFSGIFSYLWLKEIFKSEKAAFLGAIFYIWVPYRFSLIYVRASLSEMLAYTFLPLLLYSGTRLAVKTNLSWTAITALSLSGLLLSQNLVAVIAAPVIGVYFLILVIQKKSSKYLLLSLLSAFWGIAIAQVTYAPSLFERKYIRLDEIIRVAYYDHFVTLRQLIRSPWEYGFDLPGTVNDHLSFQIGLVHLLVITLFFFFIVFLVLTKILSPQKFQDFVKDITKTNLSMVLFFFSVIIISIFLMLQTKLTVAIWQEFRFLQIIDIPWRLLGVVALSLSFLSAFLVKSIKFGLFFLMLIALVFVANRNHLRINQPVFFDDGHFQNYHGTATQYDEFTPKWRQTTRVPIGFDPNIPVEISSGQAQISNVLTKSNLVLLDLDVKVKPAQVQINKFYFPNWEIFDNGRKLSQEEIIITNSTNLDLANQKDSSGLIAFNLPKGYHRIEARFSETALRTAANFVSFIAMALALSVLLKNVRFLKTN